MPKSKKKVAADKSKLSQDKVEAFKVDEDSMSKSKDGEPTQPATTTSTVKEDGASDEDHGPVKQHDAEETKKKRCTNNDNDDDNNKSASKKNDDKSLCDNASTAKKEDEGSTSTKEVVDETTTDCCSPKNTTDTSPKKKKNGDDVADKKCANNKAVTDKKQQKKKIDNSSQSSSGKEQSTKNDCCAKTSTSAASRTSSNPTTKSNNTTSSSNVTISTTAAEPQTHAQQSSQPPTHYNTHSSSAASAAVAQQQQQQSKTTTTTTQYTSLSDLDDNDGYSDANDTLLKMSFNQDGGCLAVGTGSGFRICNVHPFEENLRRTLGGDDNNGGGGGNTTNDGVVGGGGGGGGGNGGGIAQIEMLYRTNLLAITGSSSSSSRQFPPNKVLMYDDHYQRTIGELIFRQRVLTTRLRRDRIIVVLRDRTYIYNFADMTLLDKIYTGDNPLGLIGISLDNGGVGGSTTTVAEDASGRSSQQQQQQRNNGMVLAFPSKQQGQVRVELYGLRRSTVVNAHESSLGALALSIDGSLLATASERGTVIRLFDTRGVTIGGGGGSGISSPSRQQGTTTTASSVSSSVPLREFRRGVDRATISCLTFSLDSNWLGCASDHGTVHIFQTYDPNSNNLSDTKKKKTRSSSMTGKAIRMLPKLVTAPKKYIGMDGVHSYAQVRGVPRPHACAFVPDREQTIAVAGMDEYGNGCLLLAEFGSKSNTTSGGGGGVGSNGDDSGIGENNIMDDTEARRVGYHRFFKSKSPSSQIGSSRRRTKSKDCKIADDTLVEGGAYIDDTPIDLRMDHISIGDENEDHFVPIDYNMRK